MANYSERSKYFYFDSFKMNIISTDTEAQSKNFNGVYHSLLIVEIIFKGGVHIEIYKGYDRGYRAGG